MKNPPLIEKFFPCQRCGASLKYSIKTGTLKCPYCGYENKIEEIDDSFVKEYDFKEALLAIEKVKFKELKKHDVKCPSCGAIFVFEKNIYAGKCPYCGTFVVEDVRKFRPITAQALLPFKIKKEEAFKIFRNWINSLWFAPSKLKSASFENNFSGIYLPYWTYDSYTVTYYRGSRGDIYYEQEYVMVNENGRWVRKLREVQKVRWTPVSGRVERHFDDVLVGASQRLPRKIIDALKPWTLDELVPYDEKYISGFESEVYQVNLDDGYEIAKYYMQQTIRNDIRRDIGGDLQQIHSAHTEYREKTFKHILLPIWSASFRYENKTYRFAINAVTGKIKGERPYSKTKIILTVLIVLTILSILFYLGEESGFFEELLRNYSY